MKAARLGRRSSLAAAACSLLIAACSDEAPQITRDRVAGACSIHEPGAAENAGAAAYVEHVTPTVDGGFGVGSLGVSVVCAVDGTAAEQLTLILPNLIRGRGIPVGEYRVRSPYHSLSPAERVDPRSAWVRVQRGGTAPLLYIGVGGSVVITRADSGIVEGAYHVAVAAADSAVSLPGAVPEVRGAVAGDSLGAVPTPRTVLGGAFLAPRQEADWRGR
jgi:hypothetical protein